ncbi:hypothetical protein RFI_01943 [Reticulomyxa filosa]|uniref:Uncharacterized protein n=1 Tax=Reticulomyxa filosa TaxID=46433 RepID=X6PAH6_RETFI|nr:hypothetical protein RFI_01943 [Reticulomyxa filosa]|eukprot:ETO35133.1 hypothetical protein RFI_01943 [Reticulomyxa filosa]
MQLMTAYKRRYVIVGTNKGRIYHYPVGGSNEEPGELNVEVYINPNNNSAAILHLRQAFHKHGMVYVTAFGWQIINALRSEDSGEFCRFDDDGNAFRISSAITDKSTGKSLLYVATANGELLVYDLKQNHKRGQPCLPVHRIFVVNRLSPLSLQIIPNHLLVATDSELYVYHVKWLFKKKKKGAHRNFTIRKYNPFLFDWLFSTYK